MAGIEQAVGANSAQGSVALTTSILAMSSQSSSAALISRVPVFAAGTIIPSIAAEPLAIAGLIADVTSAANAEQTISFIDAQILHCNSIRAYLGATRNALTSIQANLSTSSANLQTARARVKDTDYAAATSSWR
jgi:flagellin